MFETFIKKLFMPFELSCPVDLKKVNENKVRLTAVWVLLLAIGFATTKLWLIPTFLVFDFSLRTFDLGKYSLLHKLSNFFVETFEMKNKPVAQAPKVFATQIGLIFSILILASLGIGYSTLSLSLTSILILFAFLESVFGFCAGCYVYTFQQKLFAS